MTVREIQRATLYEGITSFKLGRTGLVCTFDPDGAAKAGVSELRVAFEIEDQSWKELAETARIVFRNRDYFQCEG